MTEDTSAAPRRQRVLVGALSVVLAALCLLYMSPAASAAGQRQYQLGIYDNAEFVEPTVPAGQHQFWLDRAGDSGSSVIRIDLVWRKALVDESVPPADPANPGDSNYDFTAIDSAVREATGRGMSVLLTIWGAPEFAEGAGRPPVDCAEGEIPPDCAGGGTWKPDPSAFADFGAAVATRYSGLYTPGGAASPLPKVRYLQAWNEPNLFTFMNPQLNPDGSPFVVGHYRQMLNAFYDAVHSVQPDAVVLGPGTAPAGPGNEADLARVRTGPLDFMRQLFCVRESGGKIKVACSSKPKFDVFAHNAIPSPNRDVAAAPYYPNSELRPSNFEKGVGLLRAAEGLRQLTPVVSGGRAVWATEFWTASNPPDASAPSLRSQADTIQRAMRLLWEKGADVFLYFKIRDQIPFDAVTNPDGCTRQCGVGLYPNTATWPFTLADEPPKPALTAFSFPFTVERASKTKAIAWFRPPLKGNAVIEQLVKGKWTQIAKIGARKGVPVTAKLSLTGKAKLRARMGSKTSLDWALAARG